MKPKLYLILLVLCCLNGLGQMNKANDRPSLRTVAVYRCSAYCPCEICCGEYADGITASGKPAKGFFVAAPHKIPFYTRLVVPGYAGGLPVPVLDRGSAIKEGRLDVFFNSHQEAKNWGIKYLEVRFVK